MEIILKGEVAEIATLALAVQGRQKEKSHEEEHPHEKYLVTAYKKGRVFLKEVEC